MEMVFLRQVLRDGKVTVPRETREVLDLEPGDYVELSVRGIIKTKDLAKLGVSGAFTRVADLGPQSSED